MIAEHDIRTAILSALRNDSALTGAINGVYDGVPIRATVPYAVMGDVTGNDWGAKDMPGRELVLTLSLYDRSETAVRLATLASAIHAAMLALPPILGGWHVASIVPLRSRLIRGGSGASGASGASGTGPIGGQYSWQSEWRLRVLHST